VSVFSFFLRHLLRISCVAATRFTYPSSLLMFKWQCVPLGWQLDKTRARACFSAFFLGFFFLWLVTPWATPIVAVFDLPESLEKAGPRQAHILYGYASRNSLLRTWSNQLERIIFAALYVKLSTAWPDWVWPGKGKLKAAIYLRIYSYSHLQMSSERGYRRFKWPSSKKCEKRIEGL